MSNLPKVSCKYGAPMGRFAATGSAPDLSEPVTLRRVRINSGGYDDCGAYWGRGRPLYYAASGAWSDYFRAADRDKAKAIVREQIGACRFYR